MLRATLLSVGSLKNTWAADACADYMRRMGREIDLKYIEIPDSRERDAKRQIADESARMFVAAEKLNGQRFILDEAGLRVTSTGFAELLGKARDRGDHVIFLLGGAHGFNDEIKKTGQLLRLSDMTLPHELCRVVFVEQLYRAGEILRGSGYHHA